MREKYDTSKIARELADLECDEFIDLMNHWGMLDDDYTLDYILSEIVDDDCLSDEGKKILTRIGLYALDDAVNDLEQKYHHLDIDLPDGSRVTMEKIISNWWNDLWRNMIYG